MDTNKIIIFDTTLRDGEQSPGASLTAKGKLEIAEQLARLKVDVIEAGFPISSHGDFDAVKAVARQIKGPVICGLARCLKNDIDAAYQAVKYAKQHRIHVFLATSKIHMKYKLRKAEDEILRLAVSSVKYAKKLAEDIEFSPEDASRTDKEFLYQVVRAVIDAGATTVNIPDTVGYAIPSEFGRLIKGIQENVENIDKCVLSVHCHNDLGLGVANSIAALQSGARQIECTINGLGERAGNASLEEIVMAVNTRRDLFELMSGIKTEELYKTSQLVSRLTGIMVQPNKAVVGANAFSHESGIHQDGVLKRRTTYEIMRPSDVGVEMTRLVLGKHSGRHAFSERLKKLGFVLNEKETNRAFEDFKKLADKKKEVFDEDLIAIVEDSTRAASEKYRLDSIEITSGNKITPHATIRVKCGKKAVEASSTGDGPVDACYKAIDKVTGLKGKLLNYSLRAITGGKDAVGDVTVRIKVKNEVITGRGSSTDIIEASAKAYLNAINRMAFRRHVKTGLRARL
ncbi:MAG: 2-isopropylmalate synthase [Candidatus Omnitrophota bacterium]|nr:2-isopropylmalate synthase [Candidatus Omnitrophota bacterium]